jgi:hypothetical protein
MPAVVGQIDEGVVRKSGIVSSGRSQHQHEDYPPPEGRTREVSANQSERRPAKTQPSNGGSLEVSGRGYDREGWRSSVTEKKGSQLA